MATGQLSMKNHKERSCKNLSSKRKIYTKSNPINKIRVRHCTDRGKLQILYITKEL